jgi:TnpA family transposase
MRREWSPEELIESLHLLQSALVHVNTLLVHRAGDSGVPPRSS